MGMAYDYDFLVIGGGSGGVRAARMAATYGAKVAVIEEYRVDGRVTMIHVTPKVGVPYYLYDDDHNGRLDRSDAEKGEVKPVYYTIYEWD